MKSSMNGVYTLKATVKPKWYQFRHRLSSFLVRIARKIHPENPDVMAFYAQLMMDQMLYGSAIVRQEDVSGPAG